MERGAECYARDERMTMFGELMNTDLQPNDDEVPEADHAELRRRVAHPCLPILDRDDVHEVQDQL